MFMPKSTTLMMLASVEEMMVALPGLPVSMNGLPSRSTIVGVIELSGRLPGSTWLITPWTRPAPLATPGLEVKSSISSLRKKPVLPAICLLPNRKLTV